MLFTGEVGRWHVGKRAQQTASKMAKQSVTEGFNMNSHERIDEAIRLGTSAYIESRRQLIKPFVDKHYCFKGAWRINSKAMGWDMLRAPANMLWMPVYFFGRVVGSQLMRRLSLERAADKLDALPAGLRTDVEREVEWLLYSEFLELPFSSGGRSSSKNAWVEAILGQPVFLDLLEETLRPAAAQKDDPLFRQRLEDKLSTYIDNRKDVAEIASTLLQAAVGLTAFKQLGIGSISLGQSVATALAYNLAVSNFFLGSTAGSLFYSLFPHAAAASTGMVAGVTGGVAAIAGIIAAFAGLITDPAQKALGLHEKKLADLLTALEKQLSDSDDQSFGYKEGLTVRLLDMLDMLAAVVAKSA